MKNLLYFFICFSSFLQAQDNCIGTGADKVFHANRIGASFSPQGSKFDPGEGFFKVPYTSENAPYTLFASSPWIGGYKNGELNIAAQRYTDNTHLDFYTGPLLEDAVTLDTECYRFNKIWSSNRNDILRHIEDFALDGEISDTITSVFGWPAEGNNFFSDFNGFELPIGHRGGWADFSDQNNNGIYEPQLGEYPCIYVNDLKHIPEEVMWMVFNDQGPHTASGGLPLGVEIQLTVFAFNCQDNAVLNNALFNNYKIINQNAVPLDSVHFGMWADYDLGCSEDDYLGCDTSRNTEYVYNQTAEDGSVDGGYCITGITSYGDFPPIQSLTYLSHRMTSFILAPVPSLHSPYPYPHPYLPAECYNLLNGIWRDGSPITKFENGYNPAGSYPTTKFLYPGDPRDLNQWSQNSFSSNYGDPSTLSSVYIGQLLPYEPQSIETVYLFHQDSSLDNIGQVGFMQYQIDSLLQLIKDTILPCIGFPYCEGEDCVWPGDFDHNGIADHYDLLYWGVMKDSQGGHRNGRINWDGHTADAWTLNLPNALNAKHGDGNGNGIINDEDIDRNIRHYLYTNPYYESQELFPAGPEIVLTSRPMAPNGQIKDIGIRAGIDFDNVLGLAYEIDFDTSIYTLDEVLLIPICPDYADIRCLHHDDYIPVDPYFEVSPRYAFVKTDHQAINISQGFTFERVFKGLVVKEGVSLEDIPDTVVIRLKNLIAIDADGNDLHIGATALKVVKGGTVSIQDPLSVTTSVYPNPADDIIEVLTELETSAQIFSLHGQLIKSLTSAEVNKPIDVSTLPSGLYIIRIAGSGESIKIVVQ